MRLITDITTNNTRDTIFTRSEIWKWRNLVIRVSASEKLSHEVDKRCMCFLNMIDLAADNTHPMIGLTVCTASTSIQLKKGRYRQISLRDTLVSISITTLWAKCTH